MSKGSYLQDGIFKAYFSTSIKIKMGSHFNNVKLLNSFFLKDQQVQSLTFIF
jgi:hypothetical protein